MAFYTNALDTPQKQNALKPLLQAMGRMFENLSDAQNRTNAVKRMQDMSDADLAKMGVPRSEIVRYVYRDIFHV